MKPISIHEIKIENESEWGKCFNRCSELFKLATNESISKEDRDEYKEEWLSQRWLLEQGYLDYSK